MNDVLHILDEKTPTGMLRQLALLAGPSDRALSAGPPPEADLPMPVTAFHRPLGSLRLSGLRMRKALGSAGVLHAWSLGAMQAARELSLAAGLPLVVSLGSLGLARDVEAVRTAAGPGLLSLTVPTEAARSALIGRGLPERFVYVLPPAAEEIADRPALRRRAREQLGLGESDVLAVVPDPMVRHAGHDMASWGHAIVRHSIENVRLLMPGGGGLAESVRFFAHTTGFDDDVYFTGEKLTGPEALAAGDLALFFRKRDVGVSALAAAMAGGTAIVGSATPDVRELTGDGEAALLVEPGKPMAAAAGLMEMVEHPELGRRLAQQALRRARKHHAPAHCRAALARIYSAAVEARAF